MPANTGRRVVENDVPKRGPYNVPPTYQDPPVAPANPGGPPYPSGVPSMGGTFDENPNWVPGYTVQPPAPEPTGASIVGFSGPQQPAGMANLGLGIDTSGLTQPAAAPSYEDMLSKYLGQVFGEGRSFAPTEQKIIGQRDDALQAMAERMASRGMGNSGLVSSGAADIFNQTGQSLASAFQDWRGQGIQEMKGALAPFIEEAMSEKLMSLSTDQKKELLNAQLDATMRQLFGADYNPQMGSAEWEPFANIISGAEPDDELAKMIDNMIRNNPAFRKYLPNADPYARGGYSPF